MSARTRLVAAFAHPDDETFGMGGVMARAADAGIAVTVLCATRGEVGQIADPSLATPETLGAVREAELRAACAALGVHDVRFLGYRDSGMAGTPENDDPRALVRADPAAVVARLVALFRELRPTVVVTFEPAGIYGHPDHVAMSRHVTAAVDALAPDERPARLFYVALPRSMLRAWKERVAASGLDPGPLGELDADSAGTPDEAITASVDVTPWLAKKQRALAAHATQIDERLRSLPEEWRARMLTREHFVLARGTDHPAVRHDLFGGLP